MECRTGVSKALLASAESTEVLGGLWDYIIVEYEVDATSLLCRTSCQLCQGKQGGVRSDDDVNNENSNGMQLSAELEEPTGLRSKMAGR